MDTLATLNFPAAETSSGFLGCTGYSGTYTAEGDDLRFGDHGHSYTRRRGEELGGVEAGLTVSGVTDYRLGGAKLERLT